MRQLHLSASKSWDSSHLMVIFSITVLVAKLSLRGWDGGRERLCVRKINKSWHDCCGKLESWWGKLRNTGQHQGLIDACHHECVLLLNFIVLLLFSSSSGGSMKMTGYSNDLTLGFSRKVQRSSTGLEKWDIILIVKYKLNV